MENEKNSLNLTSVRIKQMRLDNGWTQKDLAQKLGLKNDTAIANYEAGYSIPKDDIKFKLCDIFNCSMDYLMGVSDYKNTEEYYSNEPEDFVSLLNDLILKYKDPKVFTIVDNIVNEMRNKNITSDFEKILFINNYLKNCKIDDNIKKDLVSPILKMYKFAQSFSQNDLNNLNANIYTNDGKTLKEDIKEKINALEKSRFYMCPVYGQISAGMPNWAEECIEGRLPIAPSLMDIVDPEECFFLRVNGESMNKVIQNGAYALIRKTDWVENGEIAVVLVNGYDATLKKFSKQGDLVVLEPMSDDSSFQVQVYDKNTPIKVIGKYIGKFEMK